MPLLSLWMLALVSGLTGLLASYLAWITDRRMPSESSLTFDLLRTVSILTFGWCVVALATLLDPARMGATVFVPPTVMATSTFLAFLIQAVAWGCFVVFRWQALRGSHPWQRPERGLV